MASVARQKKAIILYDSEDMEDQWRVSPLFSSLVLLLSAQFWYQPILKYTHFSSLIFCLLICSASELSVTCPIPGSLFASSSQLDPDFNALHWCITLTFVFSPVLSVASNLFPLFILSVCCSTSSLSPPTNLSLSACLSPSFPRFSLHIHRYHTSSFPSLRLSHHSFSLFFFPLPSPFHLIHSPTRSPSSRHLSLSLWWLAGVSGSPTGHLSPSSQLHSLAALFIYFFPFVGLFCEWRPSDRRRWEVEEPWGRFGEQNSSVESEMCHHGNVC